MKNLVYLFVFIILASPAYAVFGPAHALKMIDKQVLKGFDKTTEVSWNVNTEAGQNYVAISSINRNKNIYRYTISYIGTASIQNVNFICKANISLYCDNLYADKMEFVKFEVNKIEIIQTNEKTLKSLEKMNYFHKEHSSSLSPDSYNFYDKILTAPARFWGIKYNSVNEIKKHRNEIFNKKYLQFIKLGYVDEKGNVKYSMTANHENVDWEEYPKMKLIFTKGNYKYEVK